MIQEQTDEMTIGGKKIKVKICEMEQRNLKFYEENPRIYSSLNCSGNSLPSQEDIEDYMSNLDHVRQLRVSIEMNGGLIDPIIVRDGDFTVLEGNSRLAAYRLLASKNQLKWATIKCKILPNNIDDKTIFQLLGQYHIIGRKDWEPFEQASYLHRRLQETKIPIELIAKELGIKNSTAKRMIDTIKFMLNNGDTIKNHWSCYDEYLKNSNIKKYRDTNDKIDETIVEAIKGDQIKDAKDIRNLGKIAGGHDGQSKKIMKRIISKEIDIYQGYEELKNSGKLEDVRKKLTDFRDFISQKNIANILLNKIDEKELGFLIGKIFKYTSELNKTFNKK